MDKLHPVYLPVVIGQDNQPVLLDSVIEAMEKSVDHEALLKAFPTLNREQIAGAILFLRKAVEAPQMSQVAQMFQSPPPADS